ncbi:MAG: hypothetical protein CVU11_00765 [Bacteroidetes bacterium HGW-Bacteroidetes-6]|jgi:peptidoglycan/LPS O-acetylase OafA/YrhL|nr:MAG: hypothetical protein CVU11_00765 [Bacteroidetes bacterium HGW-Bacteroidetes-6]
MIKPKVFEVLNDPRRNPVLDVYRGIAIFTVVLFHFNLTFPYGYLGVDLFFVISGILVGGILTRKYLKGEKIRFFRFILQRGFKIWPSYFFFLFAGSIVARLLYSQTASDQIIPLHDIWRYAFFYQNFTGAPYHWSFDHVWSLCVEEHFYIILPITLLIVSSVFKKHRKLFLYLAITGYILLGIVAKALVYFFTTGKDTYSATYNRLDALAWGILLIVLIYENKLPVKQWIKYSMFVAGILLFSIALYLDMYSGSEIYHKVVFQSVVPISFFLTIGGTYHLNWRKIWPVRIMGYYSYNWYLWHVLFVIVTTGVFGNTGIGLTMFVIGSLVVAVIFTTLVEEPVLSQRNRWLSFVFKNNI